VEKEGGGWSVGWYSSTTVSLSLPTYRAGSTSQKGSSLEDGSVASTPRWRDGLSALPLPLLRKEEGLTDASGGRATGFIELSSLCKGVQHSPLASGQQNERSKSELRLLGAVSFVSALCSSFVHEPPLQRRAQMKQMMKVVETERAI
jgi:hypothetical protein